MSTEPLSRSPLVCNLVVGSPPAMSSVYEFIGKVARTDVPLLITGETGTGKELVARAIHLNSSRRNKPFIAINCPAIAGHLTESEFC